jgi:hypothetical protein
VTAPQTRSLWSDLQRLSAVAGVLTGFALLVSGAGPGVILAILGLDDGVGLIGNIVSTAPLSLTLGLMLIRATTYHGQWSLGAVAGGIVFGAWISREAAIALGQMDRAEIGLPRADPNDLLYYPRAVWATIAAFVDTYGAQRFALAIAGGIFLAYAYHQVLLPRLRTAEPPPA